MNERAAREPPDTDALAAMIAALEEVAHAPQPVCARGHGRGCDCAGDMVRAALSKAHNATGGIAMSQQPRLAADRLIRPVDAQGRVYLTPAIMRRTGIAPGEPVDVFVDAAAGVLALRAAPQACLLCGAPPWLSLHGRAVCKLCCREAAGRAAP